MGNNRRNWHRLWLVDLSKQIATHESGLAVQFVDRIIFPKPKIGTYCSAEKIGEWTGFLMGGDEALISWMRQNPSIRDPDSIRARLARLMEEAGRAWARAKSEEAKQ